METITRNNTTSIDDKGVGLKNHLLESQILTKHEVLYVRFNSCVRVLLENIYLYSSYSYVPQ